MFGGILIGVTMNDPMQHYVAHPYYLMGVAAERDRTIEAIHTQHKPEHIDTPSHVCRACRIIQLIDDKA